MATMIINPTAGNQSAAGRGADRLQSLKGKVVGFIDNSKPNFDVLISAMAEQLKGEYGVRSVFYKKHLASMPAPASVFEQYAKECDLVITGSGD